jgi:hypothetical protein
MSSATIDRLLAPIRKASTVNNWRRPPRAYSAVKRRVPVRTFKAALKGAATERDLAAANAPGPTHSSRMWSESSNGSRPSLRSPGMHRNRTEETPVLPDVN